jgi:FMN-dependent NADH-azoreductase
MRILHIDCSPRPGSHSRRLSKAIVDRLLTAGARASVVRRDLGHDAIPHTAAEYAAALSSAAARASASSTVMALSDVLIGEIEACQVVVIGTPMNNFTVPSVLKAWIDQIVRIGRSFASSPAGKKGLLEDRPVFVGIASGGFFSGERANQPDFLTPYLSAALGCVGLKTVQFLPLQGTALLDEGQAASACAALAARIDVAAVNRGSLSRPIPGTAAGHRSFQQEMRS